MQRKNNILRALNMKKRTGLLKKRSGFAMIMAIIVVVIISTLMALSLALTTQTGKRTVDLYLYEQAVLYSKSAAELALLDIATDGCINQHNYSFDDPNGNAIYNANVTMRYVYTGLTTNVAGTTVCTPYTRTPLTPTYITTPEQSGSVLMDITVTITDTTIVSEPIRYFRRSIQKL